jgi:type II secretory pathway component PulK
VFWCLLILSLAVFAVVELVSFSVEHAAHEQLALEARSLAETGVAIGEAPQLLRDDPLLQRTPSPGHSYHVTIEDEAARLNLNFLLLTDRRDALVNLFTSWGLKMEDAQHAADSLYDWVTSGDLPSLNGAKAQAYADAGLPQRPSHQPFQSWHEVELVLGVDKIAEIKPDWQDSLTLWSDGPLDVNQASAECLAALFGVEIGRVEPLVATRNGRDGIPGTMDDVPMANSAILQAELGLSSLKMQTLQSEIVFGSNVRRIESIGTVNGIQLHLSVVTRLDVGQPQLLVWSER